MPQVFRNFLEREVLDQVSEPAQALCKYAQQVQAMAGSLPIRSIKDLFAKNSARLGSMASALAG